MLDAKAVSRCLPLLLAAGLSACVKEGEGLALLPEGALASPVRLGATCAPAEGQTVVVSRGQENVTATWPAEGTLVEILVRRGRTVTLTAQVGGGQPSFEYRWAFPEPGVEPNPTFTQNSSSRTSTIQHAYIGPYDGQQTRRPSLSIRDAAGAANEGPCPLVRLVPGPEL
jgi:hypothetical protein